MIDHEDTKTWTKKYVTQNRKDCLFYLQEVNMSVIDFIRERRYTAATIGLDRLLNGLIPMSNAKVYGDLRPYLSILSCVQGEIMAFADPADLRREGERYGVHSSDAADRIGRNLRSTAVTAFQDAMDLARSSDVKDFIRPILSALKADWPMERIQREYVPDFPQGLPEVLLDVDLRFFIPEINKCVSEHLASSPPPRKRAAKLGELDWGEGSSQSEVTHRPPSQRLTRAKLRRMDFDDWAESMELDESDLETLYETARFRRNLFGLLTAFTPFGILFAPFWGWAMFWTKALRYRDFDVMPNFLALFVLGVYYIGGLLIYPMLVLWVAIPITGWCMWPDKRDKLVPLWTILGLWVLLVFLFLVLEFGVLPLIVLGVLALLFWCWKKRNFVPALVAGGLGAAALVAALFFFPTSVSLGTPSLPDGLTSLPGKIAALPNTITSLWNKDTPADSSSVPPLPDSLEGNWYDISLYTTEDSLEPNYLILSYYSFQEDGTCDHLWQRYQRAEEGLSAFQWNWQPELDDLFHNIYATDESEQLLSLCSENAPPDSFFQNSEYESLYHYEFRNGLLSLQLFGSEHIFRRTDRSCLEAEQLITELSDQSLALTGSWSTARREHNSIWTSTYTFYEDGTFLFSPCGFDHAAYAPFPGESGWYVMPMGHPASYGTYTFDGTTLVLIFLGSDVIDPDEWTDWTEVMTVGGDLSDSLELDGTRFVSDDGTMSIIALCDALDVDASVH